MLSKKYMVLIVAYNAQSTIINLLHRIPKKVWQTAEEIIIADDASQDNTSLIAEDYKRAYARNNLTIIHHTKNKGYGGNQKWGYAYAIRKKYDAVVMVHGDAQYPPEQIHELVTPLLEGKKDFMFGSRMAGNPLKGGMPLYKYFGNIFLTTLENFVLGTSLTEFHSGFRAYSTVALQSIPLEKTSDGFHFDSEIIIQLIIARKRIGEIIIPTRYGTEKCHVKVIPYGLHILFELIRYLGTQTKLHISPKYLPIKDNYKR
jgi:glycosyltransferase involved in cell wall biosynthesis